MGHFCATRAFTHRGLIPIGAQRMGATFNFLATSSAPLLLQ